MDKIDSTTSLKWRQIGIQVSILPGVRLFTQKFMGLTLQKASKCCITVPFSYQSPRDSMNEGSGVILINYFTDWQRFGNGLLFIKNVKLWMCSSIDISCTQFLEVLFYQ